MSGFGERYLLPAGLTDVLPPQAEKEASVVETLMATFAARGYARVKPPLLEFEDTLLDGAGADVAQQSFRVMDPQSQRMLALRADMTPQVARIARSRMVKAPRPLRLCYSGQILQVQGSQLRPGRQVGQVGAELIGTAASAADAEVILMAGESLAKIGVPDVSIDLNLPTLASLCARDLGFPPPARQRLRHLLDRKDAAAVADAAGDHKAVFLGLLQASGPADAALGALARLPLPKAAGAVIGHLDEVVAHLRAAGAEFVISVDPVEHRGFEYHEGISFIIFSKGARGELGRGGRYRAAGRGGAPEKATATDGSTTDDVLEGEASTGFSLFMDTVLQAVPAQASRRRIFLPYGTTAERGDQLRAAGWVTVSGLRPEENPMEEARAMNCGHLLRDGKITERE